MVNQSKIKDKRFRDKWLDSGAIGNIEDAYDRKASTKTEIKGYLIRNQDGDYLAKGYHWYGHETFNEAWVHPESELEGILNQSKDWDLKPCVLTRALYNASKKSTTLISSPIDIQGLDVLQINELINKKTKSKI
jgi:hypothetical protein